MSAEKKQPVDAVKLLADLIYRENHFAQDAGGKLYRFSGGVYRRRAEEFVKARVKRFCVTAENLKGRWKSHLANEVVEFIRVDAPELWERPLADVLNCRNGLLHVESRELREHSPEHLSSVQLPVKFDPAAKCPAVEAFVRQTFPDDAHSLAWEVPAWLMLPNASIQKAVLLTGEGANGKSTWLNLVVSFLGKPNVSSISLHKLESDQFATARLVGKLANICADLPSEHLAGTSTFKALTGGDTLPAEYKFHDSFDFEPFARLVFSANHPPRSADSSHAFFRRWIVIPFDRTFEPQEQIPREELDRRLTATDELSGLLNHALDALQRLRTQRGFSEPESIQRAWSDFHATTDPLAVWLDRFTLDDPDAFVPAVTLRTAYNAECEQRGRPGLGERSFGRALRQHRPRVERTKRTVSAKHQWCYVGIGLNHSDNGHGPNGPNGPLNPIINQPEGRLFQ